MNDTIVAISSAVGVGAISIVRLTGEESIDIVNKCFKGKDLSKCKSHTIHYGHIYDSGEVVDEVMVTVLRAPKTYTKEDVVEVLMSEVYGKKRSLVVFNGGVSVGSVRVYSRSVVEEIVAVYENNSVAVRVDLFELLVEPLKAVVIEAAALNRPYVRVVMVGRETDNGNAVYVVIVSEKVLVPGLFADLPEHILLGKLTEVLSHSHVAEIEVAGVVVTGGSVGSIGGKLALTVVMVTRNVAYLAVLREALEGVDEKPSVLYEILVGPVARMIPVVVVGHKVAANHYHVHGANRLEKVVDGGLHVLANNIIAVIICRLQHCKIVVHIGEHKGRKYWSFFFVAHFIISLNFEVKSL